MPLTVRRTKNKLKNTVILSAYGKIKGKKYLTRRPDEKARGGTVTAQHLLFRGWGLNFRREAFKKSF